MIWNETIFQELEDNIREEMETTLRIFIEEKWLQYATSTTWLFLLKRIVA